MPRIALIGWLAVGLSLAAPSAAVQAAQDQANPPAIHRLVTTPSRPAPAASSTPVRVSAASEAAPDRLVVTFSRTTDVATARRAHAVVGATPLVASAHGRVQVVRVDPAHRDAALASYRQQAGVASVSVDRRAKATELPGDPLYSTLTSGGYTMGWSLDAIGAPAAWNVTHGDGVLVAVLDTGVLASHEDLAGQLVGSRDFTGSAAGASDVFGHGTHVAGIIAAAESNGHGLAGVAPRAKILDGKILGDDGSGYLSDEIAGIQWAVQQGARVINLSLGADGACDPSEQAVIDDAWSAGVVLVAAAGNSGASGAIAPANCNHVIGVGASTIGGPSAPGHTEGRAWFSNHGAGVQVAAPGDHVYSTMLTSGSVSNSAGYGPLSGTSMATPQVAGAAALVWATQYGTSNEAVVHRLTSTADPIAGTGTDWTYGRVNAAAAVGAVLLGAPGRVDDGLGSDMATQTATTQIAAHWTAVSGAVGYEYEIGTAPGLGDVVGWTDNGAALAMTQTGLSLSNNVTYYTSVRAYDGAGTRYGVASSNGVQVTVPAIGAPAVVDDGGMAASLAQLSATWSAVPGAVGYEYAISSTTPGAANVVGWTDAGAATRVTRTGLSLTNSLTYYFSVRAYDASGHRSVPTTSGGVRVLAATSYVYDGTASELDAQASTSQLSANWAGVPAAAGYEYAFGSTAGGADVIGWTATGSTSATAPNLALAPGGTYFASVRVVYDASTQSRMTTSNGVRVLQPPSGVSVAASQSTSAPLSASWNAVAGASGYQYAIGSSAGLADVLAWTDAGRATSMTQSGLSLVDGQTYYVSVRAYDAVGGLTAPATSAGLTAHTPVPTPPSPAGSSGSGSSGVSGSGSPSGGAVTSAGGSSGGGAGASAGGTSGGGGSGGGAGASGRGSSGGASGGSGSGGSSASGGSGGGSAGGAGSAAGSTGGSVHASTTPRDASPAIGNATVAAQPAATAAASGGPTLVAQSADGRLLATTTASGGAATVGLAPVALTPDAPAPTGRLRLIDSIFAVSTADASGLSLGAAAPLSMTVVPSDLALASVSGDATQLLIGYLDATSGAWIALPTSVDAAGRLVAQAPQAGTLAVFRQAPTFWVVPTADLQLTADGSGESAGLAPAGVAVQIVATHDMAYEVQLDDGSLAWLDGTQVTDVPAPDALPPLPPPTASDPASPSGDPTALPSDAVAAQPDAGPEAADATVTADLTLLEAN
jgi:thermitase